MIAIVDYKAGNLTSVRLAFEALDTEAVITSDPELIRAAERVVFPGVGAAGAAMMHLNEMGPATVLTDVLDAGTPCLGICVGTQILSDSSEADGRVARPGLVPRSEQRCRGQGGRDRGSPDP